MKSIIAKKVDEQIKKVYSDIGKHVFKTKSNKSDFAILKAHLLVESYINDLLVIYCGKDVSLLNKIQKGEIGFYQKFQLLKKKKQIIYSDYEWESVLSLNRLRNKFAHNLHYTLNIADIDNMGMWLGERYFEKKYAKGQSKESLLQYTLTRTVYFLYRPLAFSLVTDGRGKKVLKEK